MRFRIKSKALLVGIGLVALLWIIHALVFSFNFRYAALWGDLSGTNWDKANLDYYNFTGMKLRACSFSFANLRHTEFKSANLVKAKFSSADMKGADLQEADLRNTDMFAVNLRGATLNGANLTGSNLDYAILLGTDLRGATLTNISMQHAMFDLKTQWPTNFDPKRYGAIFEPNLPDQPESQWSFFERLRTLF